MKRRLIGLAALLGLSAAQATLAPALTLEGQAKRADVIVRAVLGAPATVQDGGVTYLAYPLAELKETVAGDAARLPQHEGKPALFFLQGAQDLPTLLAGQEIFALLYARKLDSPLVGFNQGLYPVVNGSVALNSVTQATGTQTTSTQATVTQGGTATQTPTLPPVGNLPAGSLPVGSLPNTTPPQTAAPTSTPGAATPAPAPDPNTFPTDPAKFRDALRAARGNA